MSVTSLADETQSDPELSDAVLLGVFSASVMTKNMEDLLWRGETLDRE